MIQLRGTLTLEDVTRFMYFHMLRRVWWLLVIVAVLMLFGLSLAGLLALAGAGDVALAYGVAVLIILAFAGFRFGLLPYIHAKKLLASTNPWGGEVTRTFSPEHIESTGPAARSEFGWTRVDAVYETRSGYLIYLGPVAAVVIPKRWFVGIEQEADWRTLVERQISPKRLIAPGWLGRRL
ncbi:MAG: YcxB family protein [Acidobacteriota bacterium]